MPWKLPKLPQTAVIRSLISGKFEAYGDDNNDGGDGDDGGDDKW